MGYDAYIRKIHVHHNWVDRDFDIELTPEGEPGFRHLILTGRNGSGKTVTLNALHAELAEGLVDRLSSDEAALERHIASHPAVGVTWTKSGEWRADGLGVAYFVARRGLGFEEVKGPTADTRLRSAGAIEQWLVNLRTQIALASEDGDQEAAAVYRQRIEDVQALMRRLFDEPTLSLEFDRDAMSYRVRLGSERVPWDRLPDGYLSTLELWADARARDTAMPVRVVLIDEIEAHLHLGLQEVILPILVETFPRSQFIVATHSPAVICSIDHAVVYDLSTHVAIRSEELRGITYGTLMTEHFGISSEFDLETTARLAELAQLVRKDGRTSEEEQRVAELTGGLARRSPMLALLAHEELRPPEASP